MKPAISIELGRAEPGGRSDLLDLPRHEDGHPVGERHRLFLIMGHVHRRDAERAL